MHIPIAIRLSIIGLSACLGVPASATLIRLGIIGLSASPDAWATTAHVAPLQNPPLNAFYQVVALATSNKVTAKAAAEAYNVPLQKAYWTPEAIAEDKDVDMVVVSVKVPLHKQLVMPALEAKKTAFVEWPLGANLAEAEEMAATAKSQGVKTLVGLQSRASPSIRKAKEMIDSGALGRIIATSVVASSSRLFHLQGHATLMQDASSGANLFSITGGHILDSLCFLLGEFKALNALVHNALPEVQVMDANGKLSAPVPRNFADSVGIHGVLESGASVSFSLKVTPPSTPDHFIWIISGEKMSLKLEGNSASIQIQPPTLFKHDAPEGGKTSEMYGKQKPATWEEVEVKQSGFFGGTGELYEAFAKGETEVLVDFEGAVVRHKMVEAVFTSGREGRWVSY